MAVDFKENKLSYRIIYNNTMEQGKFMILSHHNIIIILLKSLNIYFN